MNASATSTAPRNEPAGATVPHERMANAIRALAMDAVEQAKSGHPGLPMGAADIATVLFTRFLKFDPADPAWPDRDRFILSAGHGSMLIYALLYLLGYSSVSIDDIKNFRKLNFRTPGHPENFVTEGVETTTGPLGQGIANAVGFAIAERHLAAVFGKEAVDHKTYVLVSDGDLMEGVSQEAIALAGHLKLARLIVLFDDNGISIDGALSLSDSVDQVKRFEAAGWNASRVDGHDPAAIAAALEKAQTSERPSMIACKTKIGFGAPTKEGKSSSHGSPLGAEEIAAVHDRLQDQDRLRRADQGRQIVVAWFPARCRRDRGRPQEFALGRAAIRSAAGYSRRLAQCRRARQARARRLAETHECARRRETRRIRTPHQGRIAETGARRRGQGGQGQACRRAEGYRDAHRVRIRAGGSYTGYSRDDRRFGRPYGVEQHTF